VGIRLMAYMNSSYMYGSSVTFVQCNHILMLHLITDMEIPVFRVMLYGGNAM